MSGGRSFELRRELGSGAFGSVYLAEMVSLGGFRKQVALKVLKADVEASSDEAVIRLRDEARLLGRVRHRNIVQVDDLVRVDGRWAVVMEYIAGHDLKAVTDALNQWDERMPRGVALEIIGAIADALDVAYNTVSSDGQKLQVIHRDIKPANVRLTKDGDLKVLDFGIARGEFVEREAETKDVRFGTLQYMAPERVLGDPETPAGDVYSLGIMLYQLLTGRLLGRAQLRKAGQQLQVQEALQTLESLTGRLDEDLAALFVDMLAWEPASRPSSREVSDRARALSRRLADVALADFAGRVIPRISSAQPEKDGGAVKGTLSEELSVAAAPLAEDATPTLSTTAGTGQAANNRLIWAVVGVLFCTLGVGGYLLTEVLKESRQEAKTVETLAAELKRSQEERQKEMAELKAAAEAAEVEAQRMAEERAAADAAAAARRAQAARAQAQPKAPAASTSNTAPAKTTPPAAGDGDRLRSVKFKVDGATALKVTCGDTKSAGVSSVLLRNPPATECRVRATIGGTTYRARTMVVESRGYSCVLEGASLTCS